MRLYRNVEVDGGDPVVPIRLELPPELADLAPTLEIIVRVGALLETDHLRQLAAQQGERSFGANDTDGHVVLVKHQDTAIQT